MNEVTNNELRADKIAKLSEIIHAIELSVKARNLIDNFETIGQLKLFKKDFKKLKRKVKTKIDKLLYKDILIEINRKQKQLNKERKALIKRISNSSEQNK